MIIPNAIFILGVVLAGLYLKFTGNPTSWLRSILKTLPVVLFALAAIVYQGPVWLILALVFSAIGDFALSRPSTKWFLTGMIAFAAAHLGYIVLMFELGAHLQVAQWPQIVVVLVLAASTEIWLRPHTADLKWPVRGYVVIILAMALVAIGLPDGRWLALSGALLFVVSDMILSIGIFVPPQDHKLKKSAGKAVWISYIGAQVALFYGLLSL